MINSLYSRPYKRKPIRTNRLISGLSAFVDSCCETRALFQRGNIIIPTARKCHHAPLIDSVIVGTVCGLGGTITYFLSWMKPYEYPG